MNAGFIRNAALKLFDFFWMLVRIQTQWTCSTGSRHYLLPRTMAIMRLYLYSSALELLRMDALMKIGFLFMMASCVTVLQRNGKFVLRSMVLSG
jgi:hypothetical protein